MRRRRTETGEGNIGCIFWSALLIIAALLAWKLVPVKIKSAELYDFMTDQAGYASTATHNEELVKKRILAKARELELPLDADHLKVERVGDNIKMRAAYTVDVKFPGYVYHWHFDHEVNRPLYIF
jgi:cytochrome c oxidase assembly protein Cox11